MNTARTIGCVGLVVAFLASTSSFGQTLNHISKCQIQSGSGSWTANGQFDTFK
jgi:hypothetical protein